SQFRRPRISPSLSPAPPPAARSPKPSFLEYPSQRSRCPSSPRPHPPIPPSPPPIRCPLPTQSASLDSSQSSRLFHRSSPAPPPTPLPLRPTLAATSASRKMSSHPQETAKSPHRSTHKPAPAPPPLPPQHEIPPTRAAGAAAPAPPN